MLPSLPAVDRIGILKGIWRSSCERRPDGGAQKLQRMSDPIKSFSIDMRHISCYMRAA